MNDQRLPPIHPGEVLLAEFLADLTQYLTVVKAGGVRSDTSIHLFFDQNTTAFRFVLRVAGQPWLSAAIARKSGNNTLSHFVTVATRS